jgi:thermitase
MNRKLQLALSASVVVSALAGCSKTALVAGVNQPASGTAVVAGKAIEGSAVVRMKPGRTKLGATLASGAKTKLAIEPLDIYEVTLAHGKTVADLKKELGDAAMYVEANTTFTMADPVDTLTGQGLKTDAPPVVPVPGYNDPLSDKQWGVANTHQAEAIAASKGGSDKVTIAIVDTGIDLNHPDLKDKIVKGYNATGVSGLFGFGSPADDNGHGTHCAGIAAAISNNGTGIIGMAPNCKIMPVRVLAGMGSGSLLSVATGITWAADHGADVISMSLGGAGTMDALGDAVKYALAKNCVVVAAMGNSGHQQNPISYPASYPGVIAVAASDWDDNHAFFSSYNKYCSVASPGCKIYASTPTYPVWLTKNSGGHITNNYSWMSGTSMATPLVAGLCGLVRSVHPGMKPADVKALLERTADKVPDMGGADWTERLGHGRINALKAVTL